MFTCATFVHLQLSTHGKVPRSKCPSANFCNQCASGHVELDRHKSALSIMTNLHRHGFARALSGWLDRCSHRDAMRNPTLQRVAGPLSG